MMFSTFAVDAVPQLDTYVDGVEVATIANHKELLHVVAHNLQRLIDPHTDYITSTDHSLRTEWNSDVNPWTVGRNVLLYTITYRNNAHSPNLTVSPNRHPYAATDKAVSTTTTFPLVLNLLRFKPSSPTSEKNCLLPCCRRNRLANSTPVP